MRPGIELSSHSDNDEGEDAAEGGSEAETENENDDPVTDFDEDPPTDT